MPSPRGQSKRHSALEALLNVVLGFWVSVLANVWLLPLWGFQVQLAQGIEIGLAFTLISLFRSYLLRRLFNYWHLSKYSS